MVAAESKVCGVPSSVDDGGACLAGEEDPGGHVPGLVAEA